MMFTIKNSDGKLIYSTGTDNFYMINEFLNMFKLEKFSHDNIVFSHNEYLISVKPIDGQIEGYITLPGDMLYYRGDSIEINILPSIILYSVHFDGNKVLGMCQDV